LRFNKVCISYAKEKKRKQGIRNPEKRKTRKEISKKEKKKKRTENN